MVNQTPGVSEDEVVSWSVVRFLNRVAFLKEKNFIIAQNATRHR